MPTLTELIAPATLYHYSRTTATIPYTEALTPDARLQYERDGFIAVADVLSAAEVEEARAGLADLIQGRIPEYPGIQPEPDVKDRWDTLSPRERGDLVRKVWRFVDYEPRLDALARVQQGIQSVLENLLGEKCHLIQDMALLKPPFIGTEKPWHQDAAYFGWGPPENLIGVWIALDAATAENGCMHALPGTHREGATPHIHLRDCQIADERVQTERDVIVPLAPGGAMFFSSLLHHGTPPNKSAQRRWALQYHYAADSCVPMDKVEHAHLFYEEDPTSALPLYRGCRGRNGQPVSMIEP
jgi:phytanoyl-CoA hydroxylase